MTMAIETDVRRAQGDVRGLGFRPPLLIALLLGLLNIWLAPHPPMTDLPQHAAQVALLRDLIAGTSAWADLVWINLWTPYLLGYSLLLPLAAIFPIAVAVKIGLSACYVAFLLVCSLLRREFEADDRLDLYAAVGFFGFSYAWGFLPFLMAAPLALAFVLLAMRSNKRPSRTAILGVLVAGILLLVSHGLAFAYGFVLAGALFAWHWIRSRGSLLPAAPYFALGAVTVCYLWWVRSIETAQAAHFVYPASLPAKYGWRRVLVIPQLPFADALASPKQFDALHWAYMALFGVFLAAPLVMGLRIDRRRFDRLIPLAVVALFLLAAPSWAGQTAFVYERFGLFLLPAYAWAFAAAPESAAANKSRLTYSAIVAASLGMLTVHVVQSWEFFHETRAFDAALLRLDEGQRGLFLALDPASAGAADPHVLAHYPAWYQAERKGFVDLNFAWFSPMIVRFRRDRAPPVSPGFEWLPARFDWAFHHGADYRYFFAHGKLPEHVFAGAECPPPMIWSGDGWTIFERCKSR